MSPSHGKRVLPAIAATVALALAATACGTSKSSTSTSTSSSSAAGGAKTTSAANQNAPLKKGLSIVSIPKQLGNPYETIEHGGIQAALKEIGGTDRIEGPTNASASSQVPIINSVIQQKPDALIIAGNDANAVAPALTQAAAAGIKVVAMDSDVAANARTVFINQASSEEIGRDEVRTLAKQIGYKGQIAILSATANATNQNTWIKYMKAELAMPAYKNMKLVKVAYGNDDDQTSFQQTQGLIQAYPQLRGIISPTTVGIAAAARYLSTSPQKGKIALTGLGTPNQMRKFVKDGTVQAFELWVPANVGYLAGYAAAALVSGQIDGKPGESFKAGKLGTRTIGANGEILLGPPTVFNAKNIDQYNF